MHPTFEANFGGNKVYSADGTLVVCKTNFSDWQKAGHDRATTLGKRPEDAALIAQAKAILGY